MDESTICTSRRKTVPAIPRRGCLWHVAPRDQLGYVIYSQIDETEAIIALLQNAVIDANGSRLAWRVRPEGCNTAMKRRHDPQENVIARWQATAIANGAPARCETGESTSLGECIVCLAVSGEKLQEEKIMAMTPNPKPDGQFCASCGSQARIPTRPISHERIRWSNAIAIRPSVLDAS